LQRAFPVNLISLAFSAIAPISTVKSLRAVEKKSALLDAKGFVGDRRFMLVTPAPTPLLGSFGPADATHRFLTQRQCPSLATIVAKFHGEHQLTLSSHLLSENASVTLSVEPSASCKTFRAGLWSDIVTVQDLGDEVASFLQKIIDQDSEMVSKAMVRLVRQAPQDIRPADDRYVPTSARSWTGESPNVSLTDGFPLLIANQASLDELNRRLKEKKKAPLKMSNFRPNIVVVGAAPFEEDTWKVIRVGGNAILHIVKGCPRCKQSCTDQSMGTVSDEPLATLAEFRTMTGNKENIYFAQNVVLGATTAGQTISVGDKVEVLERGEPVWDDE
jgi:uncharacterized protein YcbX